MHGWNTNWVFKLEKDKKFKRDISALTNMTMILEYRGKSIATTKQSQSILQAKILFYREICGAFPALKWTEVLKTKQFLVQG